MTGEHELAELLRLVAHPDRLSLLCLLAQNESDVTELAASLGLTPSRVSQHLSLLRAHRMVDCRSVGRSRVYRVRRTDLVRWLLTAPLQTGSDACFLQKTGWEPTNSTVV